MTRMIDHHAMAVGIAEMCLDEAVHEPLRAMCSSSIPAQSAGIRQMQAWLCDWNGISGYFGVRRFTA